MPNQEQPFHHEVIAGPTNETLCTLARASLLDGFYLAGDTGLALHFGHRLSQDLDFFASELFDEEALLQRLHRQPAFCFGRQSPPHAACHDSGGPR